MMLSAMRLPPENPSFSTVLRMGDHRQARLQLARDGVAPETVIGVRVGLRW